MTIFIHGNVSDEQRRGGGGYRLFCNFSNGFIVQIFTERVKPIARFIIIGMLFLLGIMIFPLNELYKRRNGPRTLQTDCAVCLCWRDDRKRKSTLISHRSSSVHLGCDLSRP